jgi:hypothetical protein
VPLGIAAALTPTLLALQLLVVAGDHWVRRSLAVAIANELAFAIVIGLVLAGLAQLPDQGTGVMGPIDRWLRISCGTLLLVSSVYFFWPHPGLSARVRSSIERRSRNASVWIFFGLGFYFSITDFSSFLVLIPALHVITVSTAVLATKVVVVIIVLALALMPTWLPPSARLLLGRRITPALTRMYAFVMEYQFQIVGVVAVVFGLFLLVSGLRG